MPFISRVPESSSWLRRFAQTIQYESIRSGLRKEPVGARAMRLAMRSGSLVGMSVLSGVERKVIHTCWCSSWSLAGDGVDTTNMFLLWITRCATVSISDATLLSHSGVLCLNRAIAMTFVP